MDAMFRSSQWLKGWGLGLMLLAAALLAGCGPSGSTDPEEPSPPPAGSAQVDFTVSQSLGSVPLTVALDASGMAETMNIKNYTFAWTATNTVGTTVQQAMGVRTSMVFLETGFYVVTLTISDRESNQVGQGQEVITVTDEPSYINFVMTAGVTDLMIDVDATGSQAPAGYSIVDYQWRATDATGGTVGSVVETADLGRTATISFASGGTYTVTLTVLDSSGNTQSVSQTAAVAVSADDLTAAFSISPATGTAPLTVTLTATPGTVQITSYAWSVVDSGGEEIAAATGPTATVALLEVDNYIVTLTVTDALGRTAVSHRAVSVTAP